MKLKSLLIAVAALIALSAVVYVGQRPAPPVAADARVGSALADRAAFESAAQLRLSDQGKSVALARQPDGTWRVTSYFDLPADFSKLTTLVSSLTDAKLQRLVTRSPERIARLEFKDSTIETLDAAGQKLWSVTLGKNAETGGGRYVRFGQEDKAYLANLSVFLDVEPKNWADSQILNVKPEEVAQVELPFADGGPVTFSRAKKEDSWTASKTPAGQRVKADKLASVLTAIGSVRFSDTVEPTDAGVAIAKAHERAFKLTTFAGKTYTVALGRKPEEKRPKPAAAPATSPAAGPEKPAAGPQPPEIKPAAEAPKPAAPEFETVPAGPVFVSIACSDPSAPVNAYMQKRTFQSADYTFTGLPQKSDELFEPEPAQAAAPTKP